MSTNEPRPSKRERREEARAAAKKQRQAELRKEARRRNLTISAIIAGIAAIAVTVGLVVYNSSQPDAPPPPAVPPANVAEGQPYMTVGEAAEGKPVVDLYVDFMCPGCGAFEEVNGQDIATIIEEDTAVIRYHPRNFLNQLSTTGDYSSRAANAAACYYDQKPADLQTMVAALFAQQPPENSAGLSDKKLIEIAKSAGAGDEVEDCITSEKHRGWVDRVVEPEAAERTSGTPAIFINGEQWGTNQEWGQPGQFKAAVDQAAAA